MVCAPIALFTYNRPEHLLQALSALKANPLAQESHLYIFSDGPKTSRNREGVKQVREIVKHVDGFARVVVRERTKNIGLAQSIIEGVTELCRTHGFVIVLEDDLVVAPGFLSFMNQAIQYYQRSPQVMAISGYLFPLEKPGQLGSTFFCRVPTSWGWATWDRAWTRLERDSGKLLAGLQERGDGEIFDIDGTYPYYKQLKLQAAGKLDVWGVRWYASMFAAKGLCLYPGQSLVQNIGMDGSGIHCNRTSKFDVQLSEATTWNFSDHIEESVVTRNEIRSFFIGLGMHKQEGTIAELTSRLRKVVGRMKRTMSAALKQAG